MRRWEYMTWVFYEREGQAYVSHVDGVKQPDGGTPLPDALARAGADGWELAGTHSSTENWATYIFKRPAER